LSDQNSTLLPTNFTEEAKTEQKHCQKLKFGKPIQDSALLVSDHQLSDAFGS
jgi:hypothetical protein